MTTAKQRDRLIQAAQEALTFAVEGEGDFPIDMLRYDKCWPATERDSHVIAYKNRRTVELRSLTGSTDRRWASFGWRVVDAREGVNT
jgi:hypothetical protein